jgi:hypothetical protein
MKYFLVILFTLCIFSLNEAYSQYPFGMGSKYQDMGRDVAVDKDGNIYVTGSFQDTVDFDPIGKTKVKLVAAGNPTDANNTDIFVAKYDSKGILKWVFSISSPGADAPEAIKVDSKGNIYLTGYFGGSADFDPSTGSRTLNAGTGRNAFLAKYDVNEKFKWALSLGDAEAAPFNPDDLTWEDGLDVSFDLNENVYLTGTFNGKIDLDPSNGNKPEDTFTSINGTDGKPSRDIFAAAYDVDGKFQWGFAIGGPGRDEGHGIRMASDANFYLAGFFSEKCDFDPSSLVNELTSNGETDCFLAKYDVTLNVLWKEQFGSTGADQIRPGCLELDAQNNLYIAGNFSGTVNFNPNATTNLVSNGNTDIFAGKYNKDGGYIWAIGMGSKDGNDYATGIKFDTDKNVFITGAFSGTVDFDPSQANKHNVMAKGTNGASDGFIGKYSKDGNFVWVNCFGPEITGNTNQSIATGLAVDQAGLSYVAGLCYDECEFYPGGDYVSSYGKGDICLIKFDTDGKFWSAGLLKSMSVLTPNGGEKWEVGTDHQISWKTSNVQNIKLQYSTNAGTDWITIENTLPSLPSSYKWTIPNTVSPTCRVRISDVDDTAIQDVSDNNFEILKINRTITITSPNGNEKWEGGSKHNITWTHTTDTKIDISFSPNAGSDWYRIDSDISSTTGSYEWTVPNEPSDYCKVRLVDTKDAANSISDSKDFFSILPSTQQILKLLTPNGGENLTQAELFTITWTSNLVDSVKIEFTTNGGTDWKLIVDSLPAGDGQFLWVVPDDFVNVFNQCKVRISNFNSLSLFDESDNFFTINFTGPSLTLIFPNGGDTLVQDKKYSIIWSSTVIQNIKIELSKNDGASWELVADNVIAASGSTTWTVPQADSALVTTCKMKITSVELPTLFDVSDSSFTIHYKGVGVLDDFALNFSLYQNYPEPSDQYTVICYQLSEPSNIKLELYDINGVKIALLDEGMKSEGENKIIYDVKNLTPGVYFYSLKVGGNQITKKMIIRR